MNNDLISRSALKEELELSKYIIPNDLNRLLNSEINRCIEAVDNAPTICGNNPKWCESCVSKGKCASTRPQGEWKYICSYANTHLLRYECSKCGRTVDVYERKELLAKYPFCHCGADMKGGAE